jgi:hypothetical protein
MNAYNESKTTLPAIGSDRRIGKYSKNPKSNTPEVVCQQGQRFDQKKIKSVF